MNFDTFFKTIPEDRREAFKKLHAIIVKFAPNLKPYVLGEYLAYGEYHYKYKSGREGDWFTVALKNNKNSIALYIVVQQNDEYLPELFKDKLKARVGKSCINFKKSEDIDFNVVEKMIQQASKLYQPVQIQ